MHDELIQMLREQLPDEPESLDARSDLFELGLDSMGIMQLLLGIEDRFGTPLDPADLSRDNFRNVESIATLIRSKQ